MCNTVVLMAYMEWRKTPDEKVCKCIFYQNLDVCARDTSLDPNTWLDLDVKHARYSFCYWLMQVYSVTSPLALQQLSSN